MSNISFIVPTEKLNEFNVPGIEKLLREKFPSLSIEKQGKHEQIDVRKGKNLVTNIYVNPRNADDTIDAWVLETPDQDIEELKSEGKAELAKKLESLFKRFPKIDHCAQTTYGTGREIDLKSDVDFVLLEYFKAYIFDEGIHPEFIPPDYVRKPKKGFVKRLKDFL